MDYLRTQYGMLLTHLNDPMAIPLGDLVNLAGELGMPFQPDIPASLMRKAAANWTHVCQQRGTPGGISEHVTLLTGYPVDLRAGRNLMLANDQAGPVDPVPAAWSAGTGYAVGELVTYGNYVYACLAAGRHRQRADRHHVGEHLLAGGPEHHRREGRAGQPGHGRQGQHVGGHLPGAGRRRGLHAARRDAGQYPRPA